jgi:hypothetical protein
MNLDNLGKIQRVETPPFLFTRIQQKIEQSKKERMPMSVALTVSFSVALLLAINAIVLVNYNSKANTTESFAKSMHLTSNNSIY